MLTDFAKHNYSIRRITFFILITSVFILSQITASRTTSPDELWRSSALLGLSYGAMFSLAPMIILEWFGIKRFSRNWGTVALSPVLGGNIFSLMFGRNLDQHASNPPSPTPSHIPTSMVKIISRGGLPDPNSDHQCFEGLECYVASLEVTTFACAIALLLAIWATWRDRKIYAERDRLAHSASSQATSGVRREEEEEGLLPSS